MLEGDTPIRICRVHGRASLEDENERGRLLESVVESLCAPIDGNDAQAPVLRGPRHAALPSLDMVTALVEDLRSVLFPGYHGTSTELTRDSMRFHAGSTLDRVMRSLEEQILRGLCFACTKDESIRCLDCEEDARVRTRAFIERIPDVQRLLVSDVAAAYEGDPASTSPDEVVLCFPGILALTSHRLAHELHRLTVPLIPRMIAEQAHSVTGIDIHPGASIGTGCFIDHGTGTVVGETCEIGDRVRIYQGVTLGAKSFPLDANGKPVKGIVRHPIVEDDVTIYSGATILGRVTIGRGSVVGGNVWLTRSIPPDSRITQAPARHDRYEGGSGI
jgi:serine O-acetyltransferase